MTQKNTGRDDIFFLLSPPLEMPMRQFLPEKRARSAVRSASCSGGKRLSKLRFLGCEGEAVSQHRLGQFCCGLARNWRGVARGALIIEPNAVLCWALAKLREAQAPPLQVFRVAQSKVDAHFPPSRRLQATLSLAPRFLLPICRRPFPQVP